MNDRQKFIGNFLTEYYTVFVDNTEVGIISAGGWSNLEDIMQAAELRLYKLNKKIMAGKKVLTKYINTKNNKIMFWTYKEDEWWTL